MSHNEPTLKENIHIQRRLLSEALSKPMNIISKKCRKVRQNSYILDQRLKKTFSANSILHQLIRYGF